MLSAACRAIAGVAASPVLWVNPPIAMATSLAKPGQLDLVEASDERPTDEIELKWTKPTTGGKLAVYQILPKLSTESAFTTSSTARSHPLAKVMTAQLLNVPIQFRILAFNDTGESVKSNTVDARL